jgi:hypothetical protein
VAGVFGREWAGWDDFSSGTTKWRKTPADMENLDLWPTLSSLTSVNGELNYQCKRNDRAYWTYLLWNQDLPLYANWAAIAKIKISGAVTQSSLGSSVRAGFRLAKIEKPASNYIEGILNQTGGLNNAGSSSPQSPSFSSIQPRSAGEEAFLAFYHNASDRTFSYHASIPTLGSEIQELETYLDSSFGLGSANVVRLGIGGLAEGSLVTSGQITFDDFVLLPDPDDIEYRAFLVSTNGQALTNGMGERYLPEGLTCNPETGTIQGTSDLDFAPGNYRIRVEAEYLTNNLPVQNAPAVRGFADINFTLNPALPVLTLDPETPAPLVLNTNYSSVLRVGVNPSGQNTNVYRITYGAIGLPAGLAISTNTGVVTGRPTVAGLYRTRLAAANVSGTGFLDIDLPVNLTTNGSLFNVGTPVSFRVGFGGGSNYASGNLPAGLAINASNGLITGVPQGAGTNTLTVTARGPGNVVLSTNLTFVIRPSAPVITGPTNVLARAGQEFFYQIVAGGFGREWAGFDNFDTTNGVNWGVPTNTPASSALRRTNQVLQFVAGSSGDAYAESFQMWNRKLPTHTGWIAHSRARIATNLSTTNSPVWQYVKARLGAFKNDGINTNYSSSAVLMRYWDQISGLPNNQAQGVAVTDNVEFWDSFRIPSPSRYQSVSRRSGVSLAPTNRQLQFRSAGGGTNDQIALVVPNLSLSLARNWTVDVEEAIIANGWSTSYSGVGFSVVREVPGVTNLTTANLAAWMSNRYNVKLGRDSGGNYLGMHSYANGTEVKDSSNVPVMGTNARLRLRYETNGMTLIAEGSQDNTIYTELDRSSLDPAVPGSLGQLWGLSGTNARLRLALWGETKNTGGTGNNLLAMDGLLVLTDPAAEGVDVGEATFLAVEYIPATGELVNYAGEVGSWVEINRTTVGDWRITNSLSAFSLVLGAQAEHAGLGDAVWLDNFSVVPSSGFTYSAPNLPSGLFLHPLGYIYGSWPNSGTYRISISVTGEGGSDTKEVQVVVKP